MPPLGALDARALELLDAIERDPVFIDPPRRLHVVAGARLLERLASRPFGLKQELRNFDLRFEADTLSSTSSLLVRPDVAAIDIGRHVEAAQRSARSESAPARARPTTCRRADRVRLLPSKLLLAT